MSAEIDSKGFRKPVYLLTSVLVLAVVTTGAWIAVRQPRSENLTSNQNADPDSDTAGAEIAEYARSLAVAHRLVDQGNYKQAKRLLREASWERLGWEHQYLSKRVADNFAEHHVSSQGIQDVTWDREGKPVAITVTDGTFGRQNGRGCIVGVDGDHSRIELGGAPTRIMSAAIDRIGDRAVLVGYGLAMIYEASNAAVQYTLKVEDEVIKRAAFSPDGGLIATAGGANSTVRLWDAQSGEEISVLGEMVDELSTLAFSPDGSQVACGNIAGEVVIWSTAKPYAKRKLGQHQKAVTSVTFSPDGMSLVSTELGQTAKHWDLNKEVCNEIKLPVRSVDCSAFSPDGQTLAFAGEGIVLCELRDQSSVRWLSPPGERITAIAFHPDGTRLLWGDVAGRLSHAVISSPVSKPIVIEQPGLPATCVAVSADGEHVAIGRQDGSYSVVSAISGQTLYSGKLGEASLTAAAFSEDGELLAWGDQNGLVTVLNSADGEQLNSFKAKWEISLGEPPAFDGRTVSLTFAPGGRQLAVALIDTKKRSYFGPAFFSAVGVWEWSEGRHLFFF